MPGYTGGLAHAIAAAGLTAAAVVGAGAPAAGHADAGAEARPQPAAHAVQTVHTDTVAQSDSNVQAHLSGD
ncbi:hypothetical protein VM98_09020 [Streptomyces rubellomurinus subsp. indigoferus]|nr:hypothetical protein VM98_09020 [Streptomyces rubellomurinus subsp. indigoferus]